MLFGGKTPTENARYELVKTISNHLKHTLILLSRLAEGTISPFNFDFSPEIFNC